MPLASQARRQRRRARPPPPTNAASDTTRCPASWTTPAWSSPASCDRATPARTPPPTTSPPSIKPSRRALTPTATPPRSHRASSPGSAKAFLTHLRVLRQHGVQTTFSASHGITRFRPQGHPRPTRTALAPRAGTGQDPPCRRRGRRTHRPGSPHRAPDGSPPPTPADRRHLALAQRTDRGVQPPATLTTHAPRTPEHPAIAPGPRRAQRPTPAPQPPTQGSPQSADANETRRLVAHRGLAESGRPTSGRPAWNLVVAPWAHPARSPRPR